jgi:hypothetical protein
MTSVTITKKKFLKVYSQIMCQSWHEIMTYHIGTNFGAKNLGSRGNAKIWVFLPPPTTFFSFLLLFFFFEFFEFFF